MPVGLDFSFSHFSSMKFLALNLPLEPCQMPLFLQGMQCVFNFTRCFTYVQVTLIFVYMMPQNIFYNVSSAQEKLVRITFPYYQDRRWQTNLKSSISEMCVKCIEHCDCAFPSHYGSNQLAQCC